jgi:hypothetical protein
MRRYAKRQLTNALHEMKQSGQLPVVVVDEAHLMKKLSDSHASLRSAALCLCFLIICLKKYVSF